MSQEEVLSHAVKCSVAEGSYLNYSERWGFHWGLQGHLSKDAVQRTAKQCWVFSGIAVLDFCVVYVSHREC